MTARYHVHEHRIGLSVSRRNTAVRQDADEFRRRSVSN